MWLPARGTEYNTNQISGKNAFSLCVPKGGGGRKYTDQIMQRWFSGIPCCHSGHGNWVLRGGSRETGSCLAEEKECAQFTS